MSLTVAARAHWCRRGGGMGERGERRVRSAVGVIADMLEARLAADGSAEREQWCLDNWDAVAAEVAAAQNVSLGVASHQLMVARALRERLPRVAEVFAAGEISYRLVYAIVSRTALIADPEAHAKVDAALPPRSSAGGFVDGQGRGGDRLVGGSLRPACLGAHRARLARPPPRRRAGKDGSGLSYVEGKLLAMTPPRWISGGCDGAGGVRGRSAHP